ncbi:MAG: hypothetical protein FJ095_09605 [Deltaproteobacteria bacterium]|nr:hypothetical protein [Deltaproteobacteria bacterium]
MEGDLEDVEVALSAGRALWESGDEVEALRWLRRAAGTAADRDADDRALALFKVAAEIASELDARKRARSSSAASTPDAPGAARGSHPAPPPRPGRDSSIVPPLPPATTVLEVPRYRGARGGDEGEEDTFIRPETALRRALLAIDPGYAQRIDYSPDDGPDDGPPASRPRSSARSSREDSWSTPRRPLDSTTAVGPASDEAPARDSDTMALVEADTERPSSAPGTSSAIPGALLALRVAVLPIPEERDVRLVFLTSDAAPPPGVIVATLVPATEEDARRLAAVYANTDAKL